MRLAALLSTLEAIAPPRLAESWDNVGLLVGDAAAEVERALVAIDVTRAVLDEARARGCQLVVAYHPPLFRPLKRVVAGQLVFDAIRDGVALYALHTALDVVPGGTNDALADVVGLLARLPLRPSDGEATSATGCGLGRVGEIEPTPRRAVIETIRRALGVERLLVAGPLDGEVRRAAVCAGSCGDLLDEVLARDVDLYLTGELRHHDALRAAEAGVTAVAALHSNSERLVLPRVADRLRAVGVEALLSARDRDPFTIV